jgi:hypothetical protein
MPAADVATIRTDRDDIYSSENGLGVNVSPVANPLLPSAPAEQWSFAH